MNTKKIMYSILKELNEGNDNIKSSDFDLPKDELGNIVKMMLDDGLIKNVNVIGTSHVRAIFFVHGKVTLKGVNFLEENSALAKTYRGLKEIREWLPL